MQESIHQFGCGFAIVLFLCILEVGALYYLYALICRIC